MSCRPSSMLLAGLAASAALLAAARAQVQVGGLPAALAAPARSVEVSAPTEAGASISPDGKRLVFRAPSHGQLNLWLKGVDQPFSAARPLTADSARPIGPFAWSADGKSVLYLEDTGAAGGTHLFALEASGPGAARDLTPYPGVRAELVAIPREAPGSILVGLNDRDPAAHDVYRIDLRSGQRTLVHRLEQEVARWVVSRDGKLLYALRATADSGAALLEVDGEYLAPFIHVCAVERGCGPVHLSADGSRLYVVDAPGDADRASLYVYDLRSARRSLVARNPHKGVDVAGVVFSDALDPVELVYFREGDDLKYYPLSDVGRQDLRALRREIPKGDIYFGTSSRDERYHIVTVGTAAPEATYLYDRVRGRVTLLFQGNSAPGAELHASAAPGRS